MELYPKFKLEGERLRPIRIFFNSLSESEFLRDIACLLDGVGLGINEAICEFHDPRDVWDEPFEGVRFRISVTEEEIILTHDDFLKYLRLACEGYLQRHPADEAKLIALFHSKGLKLRP